MTKTNDFINVVKEDIVRCEEWIYNKSTSQDLVSELMGKYSMVSANFPKVEHNQVLYQMDGRALSNNVHTILGFLKLYALNNCQDYKFDDTKSNGVNVITNINNVNENTVYNCSFSDVREKIEDMTSLPDEEIEEILEKIDELEKIVNSSDRKTKKWSNANNIIKWMADKGVDIGISLIPLLLQIQ